MPSPDPTLALNRPARPWSERTRGAYEVWYGKVVGLGEDGSGALWFRYTLECHGPGAAPVATCWGAWFETGDAESAPAPWMATEDAAVPLVLPDSPEFLVELSPANRFFRDPATGSWRATGNLRRDANTSLAWDLTWDPAAPPFRYLRPLWLTRLIAPSGACTPTPHARFRGTVWVEEDGVEREITLDEAPGMQGHIWGTRKAHSWHWAHGNRWVDVSTGEPVDAALEVLRVVRKPGAIPLTTLYLWLDGETRAHDTLLDLLPRRRYLLGGPPTGNRGDGGADDLRVERLGPGGFSARFQLLPATTLEVAYQDTDGRRLRNRNATLARAELAIDTPKGRRRLLSPHSATLEIVTRP